MTHARSTPNANALMLMFVTFIGTILAVVLLYSVLTAHGNSWSKFVMYLSIGGFLMGFTAPRFTLFVLVIVTAYLDFGKRLLILFDRPTVLDLYFVMALAPLMMLGILCGVILSGLLGKDKIEKRHWNLFLIATGFIGLMAVVAFRHNGATMALKQISNGAAYSYLIFVVPVLFRSWQDLWKLCRFALFVYIPVGLYAIYQSIFGLSGFEIEYLESGMTIMIKELRDVRPRPFSTMNAAHTLAYMSAILMVLAFLPFAAGREFRSLFRHRWIYGFLIVFYFAVCFITMARSGNFLWLVAFGAIFAFYTKGRTRLLYGTGIAVYLSLVIFAEPLIEKLPEWDAKMNKSTAFMTQATRIQTFYDRLYSYSQMKKAENYSLFGLDHEIFTHDAITESLAKYGLIPLLFGAFLIIWRLRKMHFAIWKIPSPGNRRVVCLFLAIAFAIGACDVVFGSTAKVFPISAYLWAMIGGAMVILFYQREENPLADKSASEPEQTTQTPHSVQPQTHPQPSQPQLQPQTLAFSNEYPRS